MTTERDNRVLVARVSLMMSHVSELRIVRNQDGFYLLHCDQAGEEIADTFHLTLEEAFGQAEFDFRVKPSEWLLVP